MCLVLSGFLSWRKPRIISSPLRTRVGENADLLRAAAICIWRLLSRSRTIFSAAMKNRSNLHWVPSRIAICQVNYDTLGGRFARVRGNQDHRVRYSQREWRCGFSLLLVISKHNSRYIAFLGHFSRHLIIVWICTYT